MANVVAAPGDLDLWLAFAAGPAVWADEEDRGGLELLGGLLVGVVAFVALVPVVVRSPRVDDPATLTAAVAGLLLGAAVLGVVPLSLALGHAAPGLFTHRPYVSAAVQVSGGLAFVVGWLALSPVRLLPVLCLLGVLVGGEAAVTARSLGLAVAPRTWLRRFAGSWLHLGFLTGVALVIAVERTPDTVFVAAGLVAVTYVALVVAVLASRWVDRSLTTVARQVDGELRRYAEGEHRRRSHWLHDDVIGMLTGIQMKLEREQWDSGTTAAELRWLDHQLRLRQTEEIVRSGTATIGEVVQPYLRHAQNLGVTVTEVPAWEVASIRLGEHTARQVQRVFGVAVPNALAAGAASLAIRVDAGEPGHLVLEIEDDAGGFDTTRRTPGRGLEVLERELRPDRIDLRRTAAGTLVVATLRTERP